MPKQSPVDRTIWLVLGVLIVVVAGLCALARTQPAATGGEATATHADGYDAWPGGDDVTVADDSAAFHGNLSGLAYERGHATAPAALWAVQNGPGTLYRLHTDGARWVLDSTAGWKSGKRLHYPDGKGNVDAEGVTLAGRGSLAGIYVAAERDNDRSTVSRNSVVRFLPAGDTATLRATHEWQLTGDLPATKANLGLEAITWIPDSALVASSFFDEKAGRAYVPADYPEHGDGLFFVGLEANGSIYVYALNHATSDFTRVASLPSGHRSVMALEYDHEGGQLWSTCDATCGNTATTLAIDTVRTSPTHGRFVPLRRYGRPSTLPDVNNEGFTIGGDCVAGRRAVLWADDEDAFGHSLRQGSLPCGPARQ